jgi:hypothetical protein
MTLKDMREKLAEQMDIVEKADKKELNTVMKRADCMANLSGKITKTIILQIQCYNSRHEPVPKGFENENL